MNTQPYQTTRASNRNGSRRSFRGGGRSRFDQNIYGVVTEINPGNGNDVADRADAFSRNYDGLVNDGVAFAVVTLETPFYDEKGNVLMRPGEQVAMVTPPQDHKASRSVSNMMHPIDNQAYIGPETAICMRRAELRSPREGESGMPVLVVQRLTFAASVERRIQPMPGQESLYFNPETTAQAEVWAKDMALSGHISVSPAYYPRNDDTRLRQRVTLIQTDEAKIIEDGEAGLAAMLQEEIEKKNSLATAALNIILYRRVDPETGDLPDPTDFDNRLCVMLTAFNIAQEDGSYRAPTGAEVIAKAREDVKAEDIQEALSYIDNPEEWIVVAMPAAISHVGGSLRIDSEKNEHHNDLSKACHIFDAESGQYMSDRIGYIPAACRFGVFTVPVFEDGTPYKGDVDPQGQEMTRRGATLIPTGHLPEGTFMQMSLHSMMGVMQRSGSVFNSLQFHEKLAEEYGKWATVNPNAPLGDQEAAVSKISKDLIRSSADLIPMGGDNVAIYSEDLPLPESVLSSMAPQNEILRAYMQANKDVSEEVKKGISAAIIQAQKLVPNTRREQRNEAAPSNSPSP